MPRLTPLHWKKLKCAFEKLGFEEERQESSHIILSKEGILRPLVIPKYPEVGLDIILGLIRSAGVSREEFQKALAKC